MIVVGFVKGYSVWIHHSEQEAPPKSIDAFHVLDELLESDLDDNNDTFFDADLDVLDCGGDDDEDNGGGTYGTITSESIEDLGLEADSDEDDLEEMLKHFKVDILFVNLKGSENSKAVKDAAKKSVDEKSMGCMTHWSVL